MLPCRKRRPTPAYSRLHTTKYTRSAAYHSHRPSETPPQLQSLIKIMFRQSRLPRALRRSFTNLYRVHHFRRAYQALKKDRWPTRPRMSDQTHHT
ncbi:hypothetical protein DPMN_013560 [Dreissena polymorpha]|uniref:Uncharacterized protein n=1 Tax=Dreissena polymorpha TaxID=45954 RepID=A0A9D4N4G6_DREPO|nr:hypothetical protein DPMN_013560 [Dreissena polymorpha]